LYKPLNIKNFVNNCGSTLKEDHKSGRLTLSGSSFPTELIPFDKGYIYKDVPFHFYKTEYGDNIELEGQPLCFPLTDVRRVHLLGTSNNGDFSEDISFFHDNQLKYRNILCLTDWIEPLPKFKENEAAMCFPYFHTTVGVNKNFKPILWYQSITLNKKTKLNKIELEDNPSMHIFSITLEE
jgi:hypothetical protein